MNQENDNILNKLHKSGHGFTVPKDYFQELEDHIRSLEAEIEEVRAVIDRKKAHKNGADSLFRTA